MESCWVGFLTIFSGPAAASPIDEILDLLSKLDSSKCYLVQYLDRCTEIRKCGGYKLSFREKQALRRQEKRNELIQTEIDRLDEIHERVQESLVSRRIYDVLSETRDVLRKTLQTIQIDKIESSLATAADYDFGSIYSYEVEEPINVDLDSLVFPACPDEPLPVACKKHNVATAV
jgi:hypothetical protein